MNRALVFAFVVVATGVPMAADAESPDRVDPVLDCATPVLDADTPEKARQRRVRYGAEAIVRQLRQTFAPRLAGLFWEETEGEDSRLVLRLTGDEPVENERMTVCGEPLIVEFVPGQMHTREELQKIHSNNLEWFRGKFPGLQGTYADERTGEIVLQTYEREAGSDVEAITNEAEFRLGAPLRVEMITAKVVPQ